MEFKKYQSLTNHYRQKEIGYWLDNYPELKDEKFVISEKLHGANFQVVFTGSKILYGKRSSYLSEDESFFDWQNVMKKYEREFASLNQYVLNENIRNDKDSMFIKVYGELFGGKIQKGVKYGDDKKFKVFDIYVNNELKSQDFLYKFFVELDIDHLLVPHIDVVDGIFDALDFDTKFDSRILGIKNNICEGVVINPLNNIYQDKNGSVFYVKKKNEEFKEKSNESKSISPINDNLLKLQTYFSSYINENRLDSVISKEGDIESEKQIGNYIKLLMEDAKIDFAKDFEEHIENLDKKDLKLIYNKGNKLSANLVKKRL